MKSRTTHIRKIRIKHIVAVFFAIVMSNLTVVADFSDFLETLEGAGFDTQAILEAPSITRYETARLLNMIECEDCLHPSPRMAMTYTPSFRDAFSSLPQNSFDDIAWGEAYYEDESYYYCVAYAGDQEYMRGYPAGQSPICEGQFCGLQHTTTAEYLQILVNILAEYSYQQIRAPRLAIHARSQSTNTINSYYQTIAQSAYEACPTGSCPLRRTDELQVYLAYCRFNLESCQMQTLGNIPEGSRPISELNFLLQNDILTHQTIDKLPIHQLISGRTALELAYRAFGKTACTPDTDYDCDGWVNTVDNCSATYNPSQNDTDNDGIGDVCDSDIDDDGYTNPIGIVDERNNIDITLAQQSEIEDTCLRDDTPGVVCTSIPDHGLRIAASLGSSDDEGLPLIQARATLHGEGPITRTINGTTLPQTHTTITYQPYESGLYQIQAQQEGPHSTATATSSVWIASQTPWTYKTRSPPHIQQLQGKNRITLTHLTNSNHTTYQWIHNDSIIENESDHTYTFPAAEGTHTIIIQGDDTYHHTTVICNQISCSSATLTTQGPRYTDSPILIDTMLQDIDPDDIYRIKRTDGTNTRYTDDTHTEITYQTAGYHTLTQIITLYNGYTYTQNISLYVSEPDTGDHHIFNTDNNNNEHQTTNNIISQTQTLSACLMLQASETITPDSQTPSCYDLYQTGEIHTYQCDLDTDGIPDICDADIDNDGVANPIGLLIDENDDCSITEDIVNRPLLRGVSDEQARSTSGQKISTHDTGSIIGSTSGSTSYAPGAITMMSMLMIAALLHQSYTRKQLLYIGGMIGMIGVTPLIYAQYTTYTVDVGVVHRALQTNPRENPHQYRGFNNLSCSLDNCPFTTNPQQIDTNYNGVGNKCEDGDFDNDGIPDSIDLDDDNDTIPDIWEQGPGGRPLDTDGDGVPDHLDKDSDGDGIYDLTELGYSDGTIDQIDSDEDGIVDTIYPVGNNGLADIAETSHDSGLLDYTQDGISDTPVDTDGDGVPDFQDIDSDNDTISDTDEMTGDQGGTASNPVDTDGDGVDDYRDLDSDGDGIPDAEEAGDGSTDTPPIDSDHDDHPNFQNPDSDGDGVVDSDDLCPLIPGPPSTQGCPDNDNPDDADGDGIRDDEDECPLARGYANLSGCPDSDGDGIRDDEDECPMTPGLISLAGCPYTDSDGDGIRNDQDPCPDDPLNLCTDNSGGIKDGSEHTITNSNLLFQLDQCEDNQPAIQITECDMCPCQYAGFNAQIQAGNSVRARLTDPEDIHLRSLSLPWMVDTDI